MNARCVSRQEPKPDWVCDKTIITCYRYGGRHDPKTGKESSLQCKAPAAFGCDTHET